MRKHIESKKARRDRLRRQTGINRPTISKKYLIATMIEGNFDESPVFS